MYYAVNSFSGLRLAALILRDIDGILVIAAICISRPGKIGTFFIFLILQSIENYPPP